MALEAQDAQEADPPILAACVTRSFASTISSNEVHRCTTVLLHCTFLFPSYPIQSHHNTPCWDGFGTSSLSSAPPGSVLSLLSLFPHPLPKSRHTPNSLLAAVFFHRPLFLAAGPIPIFPHGWLQALGTSRHGGGVFVHAGAVARSGNCFLPWAEFSWAVFFSLCIFWWAWLCFLASEGGF